MVHALEEVWRTLVRGGWMLDLRPLCAQWPLEVMVNGAPSLAGTVDGSPQIEDEVASNKAIAQVVERGIFEKEVHVIFDLAYYWPTVEEMEAYIGESWTNSAVLSHSLIAEAQRLVRSAGAQSEIRVRKPMEMARYRRTEP